MTLPKMILLGLLTCSLGMGIAIHGKKRSRQKGWASLIVYCTWISKLD